MSDAEDNPLITLTNVVQELRGLGNASLRGLAQSRAAFQQLHNILLVEISAQSRPGALADWTAV